ncbi:MULTISPECIES: hypothetical protein [Duncaniella]|jgi:hypothetical protein|uniref:Acb2/Tad1 hairpin domain-containing protein n=2 Tax=Duncaniella TaxID=2518495 RepID=A0A4Z0V716_9BACT|nr:MULTISPECIES: hypothetical protein [Duncaniella]TGG37113.1 hypothetical protein EZ315_15035 [Duncaniella freteri]
MENLNVKQLVELEEVAAATQAQLQQASNTIAKVYPNREASLVKTKIEEAMMWLDKYQAGVCIDLANKTCR